MRRIIFLLMAVCLAAACCGCSGSSLHSCEAPGCSEDGTYLHLDENGDKHFFCEFHYGYLVPEDEQLAVPPAQTVTRDPALCELCENEGVLVYTDTGGTEHLLCSDHYAQMERLEKEAEAGTTAPSVCEVCGKAAILSTRTENGEEHFYCADHYEEMLGMLG